MTLDYETLTYLLLIIGSVSATALIIWVTIILMSAVRGVKK